MGKKGTGEASIYQTVLVTSIEERVKDLNMTELALFVMSKESILREGFTIRFFGQLLELTALRFEIG